jgi:hypothetical protein
MKKSILILGLIISFQMEAMAQQESQFTGTTLYNTATPVLFPSSTSPGPDKDYDFYMRRSKNHRIVGWSTLIGGVVLSGIGLLIANADYGYNDNGSSTAGVLTVAGAVSGIVSIPFMIMASAYKRKAKLMVGNQKTGFGLPANVSQDITGITLQIPLGK